ncbi:MAG: bifunctional riboflavin kinase/FAD synthetase [Lachnospiraceae bacterium]|nr:bifunctional riboflavin kinase/FAD synthetase [Lachnospiraceae bacterium]
MKVISGREEFNIAQATAVTIGKFDGLHRGHLKLIDTLKKAAADKHKTVLFTFDNVPVESMCDELRFKQDDALHENVLSKHINDAGKKLLSSGERADFAEKLGLDYLIVYPFTEKTRHINAEDFIKNVIVDRLHAKYVVVGSDFRFGYKRQGTPKLLESLSDKYGYTLIVEDKVRNAAGEEISSTLVRSLVSQGDMEETARCLGRYYSISGKIIHGNHQGTGFGIPTINQKQDAGKLLPPNGVYVSQVVLGGRCYGGITNIGCKPTVGKNDIGIETFLYDFEGDIYGEEAVTRLLKFVRPERKFASVEELIAQIKRDEEYGREYLSRLEM